MLINRICYNYVHVNFLQIMWERLYKPGSSRESGTLNQLRNAINRRNVSNAKGKDVKNNVNEIENFLVIVVECFMLAAALNHFGMSSLDDQPKCNGFPVNLNELPLPRRKALLDTELNKIINKFVVPQGFSADHENQSHSVRVVKEHSYCQVDHHYGHVSELDPQLRENPHLARIGTDHSYISPQIAVRQRQLPGTLSQYRAVTSASEAVKKAAVDGVLDYASTVLADGLLLLEFKDAIREGDGLRILRCWKVLLMYFTYAKHKNYQHEAFYTLSLVNATVSPRVASQLTWGRVLNLKGGSGHNVPLDLHMEHLNRTLKDYVANLGANVAER